MKKLKTTLFGLIFCSVALNAFAEDALKTSFGDYRDELRTTAAAGKKLLLIFEMDGCPYCEHLNSVLQEPKVAKYLASRYVLYPADIKGALPVNDFVGKRMTEQDFAKRYNVVATPTIIGFDTAGKLKFKLAGSLPDGASLTAYLESREHAPQKVASDF